MARIHDQSISAEALNARGCTLCEQSEFNQALTAFDQALALHSRYPKAWNNRGNALSGLQRYAEALAAYDQAVALNPEYHQAWFNRGKLLTEMGAYGNAVASYDRAIALRDDPIYHHARASIWLKKQLVQMV
jgi:tetratricopeptide (TPR) repeat protein